MNATCALVLLLPSLLAAPLAAQGGGFTPDDLYVSANVGVAPFAGIMRLDPLSGDAAFVHGQAHNGPGAGTVVFDRYRQRLVIEEPAGTTYEPVLLDAAGDTIPLGLGPVSWHALSPVGDGRIYHVDHLVSVSQGTIRWLDAANRRHVLFDVDGVTPFVDPTGTLVECMIYDPLEDALLLASGHPASPCPGGNASAIHVRKLPLTADGTHLRAPATCAEYDFDPSDGEVTAGISRMSDGNYLLGAHNGHYGVPLPRLLRVDPVTLAITPFASFGDKSNGGSVWSHALGQGLAQNHFTSEVIAYPSGAAVPSSIAFPDPGGWVATEIPHDDCHGAWIAYGQGLAGAGGFVPGVWGVGCAEPGAAVTFRVDDARGGAPAVLFLGLASASVPFKGGTFHVGGLLASVPFTMPGAAGVPGAGDVDLPTVLPGDPQLTGFSIFLQLGFVDGGAIKGASLTQGLRMEIG